MQQLSMQVILIGTSCLGAILGTKKVHSDQLSMACKDKLRYVAAGVPFLELCSVKVIGPRANHVFASTKAQSMSPVTISISRYVMQPDKAGAVLPANDPPRLN
jgi:hypothetical protein